MYCENCGKEVSATAKFCENCGAEQDIELDILQSECDNASDDKDNSNPASVLSLLFEKVPYDYTGRGANVLPVQVVKVLIISICTIFAALLIYGQFSSEERRNEKLYQEAYTLAKAGKYDQALELFETIRGYEDTDRIIAGINCIPYATSVSQKMESISWLYSIAGLNIYYEYHPLEYTYYVIFEVPPDGLIGAVSSVGSLFGGSLFGGNEQPLIDYAKDFYDDNSFAAFGYSDITIIVEFNDYADDNYLRGEYSAAQ